MSTAESIDELKQQVAVSLENMGVLSKIRAQLRSYVYAALREQDAQTKPTPQAPVLGHDQPDALVVDLLREFFEFYSLDYTWSVFSSEANVAPATKSWKAVADASGLKQSAKRSAPLLTQILTQFLAGTTSGSVIPSDVSITAPRTASNLMHDSDSPVAATTFAPVKDTPLASTPKDQDSSDISVAGDSERFSAASSTLTGSYPQTQTGTSVAFKPDTTATATIGSTTSTTLTGSYPPTSAGPTIATQATDAPKDEVESFIESDVNMTEDADLNTSLGGVIPTTAAAAVYGSAESGLAAAVRAASIPAAQEDEVATPPKVTRSLETEELHSAVATRDTVAPENDTNKSTAAPFNASNIYDDEFDIDESQSADKVPDDSANQSQVSAGVMPSAVPLEATSVSKPESVIDDDVEIEIDDAFEETNGAIENQYAAVPTNITEATSTTQENSTSDATVRPEVETQAHDNSNPVTKNHADDQEDASAAVDASQSHSQSHDSQFMQYETYSEDMTFTGELEVDKIVDLIPETEGVQEENYGDESYALGDSAFRY